MVSQRMIGRGKIVCAALSGLTPGCEFSAIKKTYREQDRAPPYVGVQMKQDNAGIRRRIYQLVNSSGQDERTVYCQRNADEEPDRNHSDCHLPTSIVLYQKIMLSSTKTIVTTPAQKIGF
jgi:hypothetical protein